MLRRIIFVEWRKRMAGGTKEEKGWIINIFIILPIEFTPSKLIKKIGDCS